MITGFVCTGISWNIILPSCVNFYVLLIKCKQVLQDTDSSELSKL